MNTDIEPVNLRDHLRHLRRHRALIATCTILGGVIAMGVGLSAARVYVADAALTISRSKIGENALSSEVLSTANFRPLIESRAVATQVVKEMKLEAAPYRVSPSEFFGEVVEIEEVRNSSVLLVHGRLSDPVLIADIVNRVADLGAATARRVSQQEAIQAREDIKLQLEEARARLDTATQKRDRARTTSQLELVRTDVDAALEQRSTLLDLTINIEAEKARLQRAEQELGARPRIDTVRRSIDGNPALLEAARNGSSTPKDLLALQSSSEEINPVYQDLDKQVASSRTHLAALQRQKAQMTARKLDDPQFAPLTEMYAKESEVDRLEMEHALAKKVYEEVANSYESARLLVAGRSSGLQILTPAVPPDRPESRKLPRNILIGVMSGFLLSSLFVLVRGSAA